MSSSVSDDELIIRRTQPASICLNLPQSASTCLNLPQSTAEHQGRERRASRQGKKASSRRIAAHWVYRAFARQQLRGPLHPLADDQDEDQGWTVYASAEKCSVSSVRSLAREDPVTRTVVGRRYTRRPDVYSSFVAVTRGRGAGGTPALPHHRFQRPISTLASGARRRAHAGRAARRARGCPGRPRRDTDSAAGAAGARRVPRAGVPRSDTRMAYFASLHTTLHTTATATLHYTRVTTPQSDLRGSSQSLPKSFSFVQLNRGGT